MKRTLIIGNWKMHLDPKEAGLLVKRLDERIKVHKEVEVVLAPSLLAIQSVNLEIDHHKFKLAAQNAFYKDEGAYTGEVSFTMLRDLVDYALIGHSERRMYFHETLEVVRDKVQAAVRNGIAPILCVGETHQERIAGETNRVLHDQITTGLSNLTDEDVQHIVIAYEPVWAIGKGDPAKPDEILQAVKWIRRVIGELYGNKVAEDLRVIYGASVEPEFVGGILGLEGVDGLLPGGASLNYHKFSDIVASAQQLKSSREKTDG
jgi:triosephosphate isomerase